MLVMLIAFPYLLMGRYRSLVYSMYLFAFVDERIAHVSVYGTDLAAAFSSMSKGKSTHSHV
jgi:hypothetical protein